MDIVGRFGEIGVLLVTYGAKRMGMALVGVGCYK